MLRICWMVLDGYQNIHPRAGRTVIARSDSDAAIQCGERNSGLLRYARNDEFQKANEGGHCPYSKRQDIIHQSH